MGVDLTLFNHLHFPALIVEVGENRLYIKSINQTFINSFINSAEEENLLKTEIDLKNLLQISNEECLELKGLIQLFRDNKKPVSIVIESHFSDLNLKSRLKGKVWEIYCSGLDSELFLFSFHDITSKYLKDEIISRQLDLNLRSKEILARSEEIANFGVWELDLLSNEVKWSDGVYKICEFEPQSFKVDFEKGLSVIHPDDHEKALAEMTKAIQSGEDYKIEKRFITATGKIKNILSRGSVLRNKKGEPYKLFGVFQDITEQINSRIQIESFNQRFKTIIDNIDGIFWEADPETFEFVFVSDKVEKILGYKAEHWIKTKDFWQNHIVEKDRENAVNFCRNESAAGRDHVFSYQMINAKGELIWIEDYVTVTKNKNGEPDRLYGLMFDVSKKREEELEMYRIKKELEEFYDQSLDIISITDEKGTFLKVNRAVESILGYKAEELIGKKFFDFLYKKDVETSEIAANYVVENGRLQNFENKYITKNNEIVNISWSAVYNEKDKVTYAIGRNVTNRLKAELEMRLLLDNTEESFVLLDKDLTIVSFNNLFYLTYKSNFGIEVKKGDHILDYAQADRKSFLKDLYSKVLKGQKFENEFSFTNIHKKSFIYNLTYKPALNHEGEIIGVFVSAFDITEKKHALNSLQESEKRYSNLFKFSPQIQLVYNPKRKKFVDANPAALLKLGYSMDRLLNTNYDDLFKDKPNDELLEKFSYLFNENKGENFKGISLVNSLKSTFIAEIYKNNIIYQGEVAEIILANDISDSLNYIRAIEKQNKQLSEIAWVQSHKVRAPLSRMMGLINLLKMEGVENLNRNEIIEFIINSGEELDLIIKEITVRTENAGLN